MFIRLNKIIITIVIIITTTACAHRPPNVTADIPLISLEYTKSHHNSCSSIIPNNNYSKKYSLICSGKTIQFELMQNYVSALGEQCMKGITLDLNGITSVGVFCQNSNENKKEWYLVPSVVTDLDDTK